MAKILLGDPDKNILFLYEEELKAEGYEVITAGTSREFLDRLTNEKGIELMVASPKILNSELQSLLGKFLLEKPSLKIVLFTSYHPSDFQSWNVDAVVPKSSDSQELKDTIKRLLAQE